MLTWAPLEWFLRKTQTLNWGLGILYLVSEAGVEPARPRYGH